MAYRQAVRSVCSPTNKVKIITRFGRVGVGRSVILVNEPITRISDGSLMPLYLIMFIWFEWID